MEPRAAADVLRGKLGDPTKPFTVADAEVASGLARRDVEAGLAFLTSEYRGHLRVTEDGDLVHVFPHGFAKPWETREAAERAVAAVGRGLLAAGRFIVRAWLLVVMIGYAALFLALMLGLTFAGNRNDNRGSSAGIGLLGGLFRMIGDALFWTFHPWSPLYVSPVGYYDRPYYEQQVAPRDEVRFYEKVNRFVFGPPKPTVDPHAARAAILAEIRERQGRIGLADVMRVTGLPRDEADPLMAKLMLDHDGTVEVGEQGGIVYRFESLRRTAEEAPGPRPQAAWMNPPVMPPLTGNNTGANVAVVLLNLFNLGASAWVLANDLTISNILLLFQKHPPPVLPSDGTPLALGLVPLVFSVAMFALPAVRATLRFREEKKVAKERARLAVLAEVLARAPKKEPVTDEALVTAWRVATGEAPTSKEITAQVVALGGDVDTGPEGQIRYRFADLEAEAQALEDERAHAGDEEKRLGRIVFASDA